MRIVKSDDITGLVRQMCMDANYNLSCDMRNAIDKAAEKEEAPVGKEILEKTEIEISANSTECILKFTENIGKDDMLIMEIETEGGGFDRAFYKPDKLLLKPCAVEITDKSDETITVRAREYVHSVCIEGEAVFEDNFFMLLPGETRTIKYKGDENITVSGYTLK